MKGKKNTRRRPLDSTDAVAPFARVRVIAGVICVIIGLAVLAYRWLAG